MLVCKTYIKKTNKLISNLDFINSHHEDYFFEVSNINYNFKDKINGDYIEGAIYLKYYDKVILDFKLWDYVDELWSYIIISIEKFLKEGYSEILFPDQPTKITFSKISSQYLIMILESNSKHTYTLPINELFSELLSASELFFENIHHYVTFLNNNYSNELIKISCLKKLIH